ncbi:uncharacterized protein UHO2_06779 [Ustilago hordei]|uniref:Reverse transcriptase Ty1/copia-type domain-containing protein n=1 Tax=Ustilago hordei TaxID=120017 RepID=I2FZ41_USTHO|nr:uncharacterized protein UHO2_06779 [Ustilago hordei]CCF52184.1 uncharacterized protein UHOR_08471 [Ustilago hordei]SYW83565.1 uncharacterized protein UHO2_06779 [Ustilago hordei]
MVRGNGICSAPGARLQPDFQSGNLPTDVFLNGKIDKDVYIWILPTFKTEVTENKCYRLKKALYGLKQAGRLWHAALGEQLQAFGFKHCWAELQCDGTAHSLCQQPPSHQGN